MHKNLSSLNIYFFFGMWLSLNHFLSQKFTSLFAWVQFSPKKQFFRDMKIPLSTTFLFNLLLYKPNFSFTFVSLKIPHRIFFPSLLSKTRTKRFIAWLNFQTIFKIYIFNCCINKSKWEKKGGVENLNHEQGTFLL